LPLPLFWLNTITAKKEDKMKKKEEMKKEVLKKKVMKVKLEMMPVLAKTL